MQDQEYILFEAYLSKELSKDKVLTFESKLQAEPEFAKAFNTYKALSAFLEHKFENETESNAFKDNLKKISDTHFNDTKTYSKTKSKPLHFYKYAMVACVILFLGIFTFNQFSTPQYSDYANHDIVSLTVRGRNNDLKKTAENAFNNKDFVTAENAFRRLIENDKDDLELQLYISIAHIELNNFEKADSLLENLSKVHSVFKNKAIWYLALSKLKQDDKKACLQILRKLSKNADSYEEAQKLISKLD